MADIVLTGVYDAAMRVFKTKNTGSERFEADFIDSTNMTIGQMNNAADLATRISRIVSTDATVTNLDEKYTHCLTAGIWHWLLLHGQPPQRGFERQVEHMAAKFEDFISEMADDLRNDLQDENGSDDDTNDIIGLGALG